LVRLKKYADAERVLQAAIKANGSGAVAYYYLGRALIGLARPDEALAALTTAVKIGGADVVEAHRMLGSIYLDRHDDKNAIKELDEYLALNPNATDANKLRQIIAQLKKVQ
ncbi:MAG: tetratricopeptide repeat protein, partial [Acidobacteria bacterium]|nr:tetratricopeptide repeat protein [Acidobacteriota bacterium]